MKILSVNAAYYIRGGQDRYFFDLNRLLESQKNDIIPFSVKNEKNICTPFQQYFVSRIDFFNRRKPSDYIKILSRVIYSIEAKNRIASLIETTKPHIAHLHTIYHSISPSILPAIKRYRIPIVQTLSNFDLLCPNTIMFFKGRICSACKDGMYFRAALRRCLKGSFWASAVSVLEAYLHKLIKIYEKNIDIFITPSRFAMRLVTKYGIDEKKVVFIPHFTDTDKFLPSYNNDGHFVYFGRLAEGKGLMTLLKAMKSVKGAVLYIIGEGSQEGVLKKYACDANLYNVKFFGFQDEGSLKAVLAGSMFTVFPSEEYETFGLAIIESFAMGKPVIGSNLGPVPEIIDDGINGLLFNHNNTDELSEKIQYLIDRPALRVDMGFNARKKAEIVYSPRDHYNKMKGLFNSLIKNG